MLFILIFLLPSAGVQKAVGVLGSGRQGNDTDMPPALKPALLPPRLGNFV